MKTVIPYLPAAVAVLGLSVGLWGTPGKKKNQLSQQQMQELQVRAQDYIRVGNFEGAMDLTKSVPRDTYHRDLWTIHDYAEAYRLIKNPGMAERLPAALRDSYYDAFLALQKGDCADAYQNMVHVRKYTGQALDESVYNLCKKKHRSPSSENKWDQILLLTGNKSSGVSK